MRFCRPIKCRFLYSFKVKNKELYFLFYLQWIFVFFAKLQPPDFTAKQKRGGHCPASFFIKRRRKTERLAVSCNETEPTPLQADALPSDPAGRSGIPLLYRTMGMFFVPVLSFDAYIVHDFCRNCKGLRCTMCCKIYVYFCATCPIF